MKMMKRFLSFVLVCTMMMSMVWFAPQQQTKAAILTANVVASYPANLSVKTTKAVNLMDGPASGYNAKYTLPENTMLSVKELHEDSFGMYWYEVLYYDMTLYVDATATTMVDHLTGDVTVTDLMSPAALGINQGFPIGGTIKSTLNKLGTVYAGVHYNSNITEDPAIYSTDTIDGYSYVMDSSTLDKNLIFSDLAAGSYTYLLTVEAISYYINDEGSLATSVQEVVLDNKPLIVTNASSPNAVVAKGIDVSVHQGTIDWSKVASQIDFAILRIGYEYTLDSQFKNNAAGCNANGIPFGVYIYSYAESEAEAIAEANFVINALKDYEIDLPIFFDIEDECQSSLGATAIQNIVKAFCDTIRDAGYEPGLYTFLSWFNSYFGGSYYNSLPKWVAQIQVSSCSYAKGLTMWQYSWTGSFSGISGDVDCNYYYGEFPGKNTDTSYLGKCTYYPSNMDVTVTQSTTIRKYPNASQTSLGTVSADAVLRVTGMYLNPDNEYWYQVDQNGTTGYISADCAKYKEFYYDDLAVLDPTMEDLALNAGYYLKGKLRSRYNRMYTVNAKIYSGEDTLGTPVLSSSADVQTKSYSLYHSDVCDNLYFSDLETGYYTYEISANVRNYCYNNGSRAYSERRVVLWTAPFTVGGASIEPPATVTCDHNIVTDAGYAATCTTDGLTDGSHCTKCGVVFEQQTVIQATGHSYTAQSFDATCLERAYIRYTCGNCGDTYTEYVSDSVGGHSYVDDVCIHCGQEDPDAVCKHPSHNTSGVCTDCAEAVSHTYTDGVCVICGKVEPVPTITPISPSVSFEDEVILNIYFTVKDMDDVALEDMGLLTWSTPPADGTIDNAQKVIPGAASDGSRFMVHSEGIPAKKLGDLVYFRIYGKLADGTYVYSSLMSTSPKAYAMGRIKNSTNEYLRAACVAMLNYGAEAQTYFSYKPYALMNADLTDAQKAYVKSYDSSMVQALPTVDSTKTAKIVNTGGFSRLYPTVSFDEAFSINFYFTPANTADNGMTLYYWNAQDYNALSELRLSNASGTMEMVLNESTGAYWGHMTGIAAKEIDQEAYFVGVYQSDGLTYTTGVRVYSLGTYCKTVAAKETSDMKDLAAYTAVYGYYCKQYFGSL